MTSYENTSDQDLERIWQIQASIIQTSLMKAYNKDTNGMESDRLIAMATTARFVQSLVQDEITKRSL